MDRRVVVKRERSRSQAMGYYYWLKCLTCHKIFVLHGDRYNRGSGLYCSRKCYSVTIKGKRHSMKTEFKRGVSNNKGENNPMYGRLGPLHHNFKGIKKDTQNYYYVYRPDHPMARKRDKYMMRCRLVAELCLKRRLSKEEVIHHIDSNSTNDRWSNLYIFPRAAVHVGYHLLLKYNPKMIRRIRRSNLPKPDGKAMEEIVALL